MRVDLCTLRATFVRLQLCYQAYISFASQLTTMTRHAWNVAAGAGLASFVASATGAPAAIRWLELPGGGRKAARPAAPRGSRAAGRAQRSSGRAPEDPDLSNRAERKHHVEVAATARAHPLVGLQGGKRIGEIVGPSAETHTALAAGADDREPGT